MNRRRKYPASESPTKHLGKASLVAAALGLALSCFGSSTVAAQEFLSCKSQSNQPSSINAPTFSQVATIWRRVVGDDTHAYLGVNAHLVITDSSISNAFASQNGEVVLTSALVSQLRDPGEIAFVIAHELGHIALGHQASALTGPHADELAADRIALQLLTAAAFNPCSGAAALQRVARAQGRAVPSLVSRITEIHAIGNCPIP